MIKSETEVKKVIKAAAYLFANSTYNAWCSPNIKTILSPKEFMEGLTMSFSIKPGKATLEDPLIATKVRLENTKDRFVIDTGNITQTLKEFVVAFRSEFTSIHEFSKVLSFQIDKIPDMQDMDWVNTVLESYGVKKTKEYVIICPLPEQDSYALIEIGVGEDLKDSLEMLKSSGWYIPPLPGLEIYSNESEKATTKQGLIFREL